MPRKKKVKRNTALCYIRQSRTRDEDDMNSPERQRRNIEIVCEKYGWQPEFYEDAEGHKSGRTVKNRPGWLALGARISDEDVVALVANDLARLHRKGWRVGDLIDHLEQYDVRLVLAAPGREVDTSTPQGKMFVQFTAMLDEYYAEDISQRAKDSIAYRKAQGKTIGAAPYGTTRDDDGYLIPTDEGAWLLPNGRFQAGHADEAPPEAGAMWRGYHAGAERILSVYAEGDKGLERVAYVMNDEGWAFRDRKGKPRAITADDVRRVIANWDTYGGLPTTQSSKYRAAWDIPDVDDIPFDHERAIFPVELLQQVAETRKNRTRQPVLDHARKQTNHFYALSNLTYCAHCDALAAEHDNPELRTRLTGTNQKGKRRYRHKTGIKCGCKARSVRCEDIEADFERLIKALIIDPDMMEEMTTLAAELDQSTASDQKDLETQKAEAIALCKRRIQATIVLFGDGHISQEEYQRRLEKNNREITHWEARTTETEKIAMEFTMCLEAIERVKDLWDISDHEDRQGLVRSLFTEVIYDLDAQRIVGFKLKPWADRFLVLGAMVYDERNASQGLERKMPHTGSEVTRRLNIAQTVYLIVQSHYSGQILKLYVRDKRRRNKMIKRLYDDQVSVAQLARRFDISEQRVHQILHS